MLFSGGDGEIWTLAPIARPTPLAGAPLHHLSTSPFGEVIIFATCHSIISSLTAFVKGFSKVLVNIFYKSDLYGAGGDIFPISAVKRHYITAIDKFFENYVI